MNERGMLAGAGQTMAAYRDGSAADRARVSDTTGRNPTVQRPNISALVTERLAKQGALANHIATRAESLVERLLGPISQEGARDNVSQRTVGGAFGDIEIAIHNTDAVLQRLDEALTRLEVLG